MAAKGSSAGLLRDFKQALRLPAKPGVFSLFFFPFRLFPQRLDGAVQGGDGLGGAVLLHVFQFPNGLFCCHGTHTPLFLWFYDTTNRKKTQGAAIPPLG